MIIEKDKIMHFVVSASVFFVVVWLSKDAGLSILAGLAWSFGKEYYDEWKGGVFDWNDILADLLGIMFAYLIWK